MAVKYFYRICVVFIVAIVALLIFSLSPNKQKTTTVVNKGIVLSDYVAQVKSAVSFTIQGKVVGDDDYRSIRITVTSSTRTLDILKGYEQTAVSTAQFSNNPKAYDIFLRALEIAGYTKTKNSRYATEQGVCPLGNRYIYGVQSGTESVQRSWSATCSGFGSYNGNPSLTRQLFQSQITDYSKLVSGVQL